MPGRRGRHEGTIRRLSRPGDPPDAPSGPWRAEEMVGWREIPNEDGTVTRRRDVVSATAPTRTRALALLRERRAARLAQRAADAGEIAPTLGDYLAGWLRDVVRPRRSPRTLASYETALRRHVLPALGDVPLDALTAGDLDALYGQLSDGGRHVGLPQQRSSRDALLARGTLRGVHVPLRAALDHAVRSGILAHNPARDVVPLGAPAGGRDAQLVVLSAAQARQLLATAARLGARYAPLLRLLLDTGLRIGEALALTWDAISLVPHPLPDGEGIGGQVHVRVTRAPDGRLAPPKTASARRRVTITAGTAATLRDWQQTQAAERAQWPASATPADLVWTRPDGRPLAENTVRDQLHRVCAEAGLPPLRLHDLRHTSATLLLAAGEYVTVVARRLGHASPTITLSRYSHLLPDAEPQAATRLTRLLDATEAL